MRPGIPIVECHGRRLLEVPASTVRSGRINLPVAGGGYFRLLPYGWTRWGIGYLNRVEHRPAVFYLHPWEIRSGSAPASPGSAQPFPSLSQPSRHRAPAAAPAERVSVCTASVAMAVAGGARGRGSARDAHAPLAYSLSVSMPIAIADSTSTPQGSLAIAVSSSESAASWDQYVLDHLRSTPYHLSGVA